MMIVADYILPQTAFVQAGAGLPMRKEPRRRPPRGEQENEVDPFNWYAAFSTFHFGNSYIDLSPLSELPVGNLIR